MMQLKYKDGRGVVDNSTEDFELNGKVYHEYRFHHEEYRGRSYKAVVADSLERVEELVIQWMTRYLPKRLHEGTAKVDKVVKVDLNESTKTYI